MTGRTLAIGLVVPDLVHPFFAELAEGLSCVLRERGYGLLISSSEENADLEKEEIRQLLARRVDALLIASSQGTVESFLEIEQHKTPYVLIDRLFAGLPANFVGIDDEKAGALATEHLIQAGRRRIAHIRGPEMSTALGRLAGYRRALAQHAVQAPPEYVVQNRTADTAADLSGLEAMRCLLELKPPPDGVFCYNDPTAMGAMQAILDAGLRIPEDIAVVGCGNVFYGGFLKVPLSSIDQQTRAMGARAGQLALSLVEAKTQPRPVSILLEPRLVARASTRRD